MRYYLLLLRACSVRFCLAMLPEGVFAQEIPWILLFFALMTLTEIQFRYCLPCLRATAKVLQAGIVVILLRVWADGNFVRQEFWAQALRRAVNATSDRGPVPTESS